MDRQVREARITAATREFDNRERIHAEAALAKRCGACPAPVSHGKISRYRLNGGGNRQAHAVRYRMVILRRRAHQPTPNDVTRGVAEGKGRSENILRLTRFVARAISGYLCRPSNAQRSVLAAP